MRRFTILALLGLALLAGRAPSVPECAEDEPYLVGSGDYVNGRFTTYECAHIDALTIAE
jgi:hypothetical protein